MKKFLVIIIIFLGTAAAARYLFVEINESPKPLGPPWIGSIFAGKNDNVASFRITKGRIFADIARAFGINYEEMKGVIGAAKPSYNLEKIVEGHEMSIISDRESGELKKLIYQIDSEEALVLEKNASGTWAGKRIDIPYEVEIAEVAGTINSSLFLAIREAGGDERLAIALAEMFAWQIDFGTNIRKGDTFKAIYEKRFLNGSYVSPGKILAAKFVNNGNKFKGIYFRSSDGKEGYYDEKGLSLQKIFLKSPLSYRYISSNFSYRRLNPVTKSAWGPHRAIDYAAPAGTPVASVGEGTVISSGWNGDLGKTVFVRHNETYTTVYGHLSRIAVRYGEKVKQGQIIGYVGATGLTTGPHLHYELRKFGTRVNPLTIELPPGEPVRSEDHEAFQKNLANFEEFFES